MAFFDRLTESQIRENFTHYGLFCGVVPVYMTLEEVPNVDARNWIPDWSLDVVGAIWKVMCATASWINPEFDAGFSFTVTGEIPR